MRIGFLGLGLMGSRMAANLCKKGHTVTVWNRSVEGAAALSALGCAVAGTPADAARGAEAVALCLADPPAVEATALAPGGVVDTLAPGALLVDFSTGSPELALRLEAACAARGARFLESPVTGSKVGAEQGTLVLMCGGSAETLAAARPLLEAVATKIIHVGPVGSATRVKLIGNTMIALMLEALCEGLATCQAAGVDPAKLLEVVQASGYQSPYWNFKGKAILASDFETHFSIDLMHKDLTLALEAAGRLGVPAPGLAMVREQFQAARAQGHGGADIAALARLWPRLGG